MTCRPLASLREHKQRTTKIDMGYMQEHAGGSAATSLVSVHGAAHLSGGLTGGGQLSLEQAGRLAEASLPHCQS